MHTRTILRLGVRWWWVEKACHKANKTYLICLCIYFFFNYKDLMTTIYGELVDRSYHLINLNCENSVLNSPITSSSVQNTLVDQISLAKYMRAIGNWDMYQCLMRKVRLHLLFYIN